MILWSLPVNWSTNIRNKDICIHLTAAILLLCSSHGHICKWFSLQCFQNIALMWKKLKSSITSSLTSLCFFPSESLRALCWWQQGKTCMSGWFLTNMNSREKCQLFHKWLLDSDRLLVQTHTSDYSLLRDMLVPYFPHAVLSAEDNILEQEYVRGKAEICLWCLTSKTLLCVFKFPI